MPGLHKQAGFTLLEVLVSIAVFSMIAMVSYSTLDTYIDHRERLGEHYGKLERLQRLFILLERDTQFIINRKVRNGGDILPAVMSADGNAFISMTVVESDIDSPTEVALKRVQWRLEGQEMIRSVWDVLDQNGNVEPGELLVSDEIEDVDINYFFYDGRGGVDRKSSLTEDDYPDGIELIIKLISGEQYRRIYGVSGGA